MNHNIVVERFGVRLRPVTMDDADFIFQLRRAPELSKYIGEVDSRFSVHRSWLDQYFEREGDYYFCIELLSGKAVGTISIYDIADNKGNWGRWIISPNIPAAPASVWLVFHVAFDILGLSSVYSNTVIDNASVVSFHDNCGLIRTGIERGGLTIKGVVYDTVIHTASKENWPFIQRKLEKPAAMAERLLQEDSDSV
ncbi:GNAT family N-acetyltransferase [Paenibacillus spongiae]|uniref:GNAT family N-acetyltransferase n=1 Tax=Paenibacillus spongiae TaxID=2909671 RepID=A0ABY5S577_9BACL|nr:GNAT family protein [Paenibacillus spongiae]UVI28643.1 GNAT family N-acetyltransferase [Paenibacillus spongiae]